MSASVEFRPLGVSLGARACNGSDLRVGIAHKRSENSAPFIVAVAVIETVGYPSTLCRPTGDQKVAKLLQRNLSVLGPSFCQERTGDFSL